MKLCYQKFSQRTALSRNVLVCLLALGAGLGQALALPKDSPRAEILPAGRRALNFESNQGQYGDTAAFVSRGPSYYLSLSPAEVRVTLQKRLASSGGDSGLIGSRNPGMIKYRSLRIELPGANPEARMAGEGEIAGRANYFIGNDPTQWRTGVPTYHRVRVTDVYPGINLVHYGNEQHLEYDFEVAPGINPDVIAMRFTGADQLLIGPAGDLIFTMGDEELRQPKPVIYQMAAGQRKIITGGYVLADAQTVKFAIGEYDPRLPLVIDPVVSYWNFINDDDQVDNDFVWAVEIGADGDVYLAGETSRADLATTNAYQTNLAGVSPGGGDVFISRHNNDISSRVYFTYLGGVAYEAALGLAVDAEGNAYITGYTASTNFPTRQAIQTNIAGTAPPGFTAPAVDCFIAKLGPYGSNLVFSTFYGGSGSGYNGVGNDVGYGIALDTNNLIYVAGYTYSTNFPTSNTTFTNAGGLEDGFLLKLDAAGTNVIYAMRLGGANSDFARDVAVDTSGNPVVIGYTSSTNFPVTPGALQSALNGTTNVSFASDVFISKMSALSGALTYSTFLGGTNSDRGYGLALDATGAAYVTGWTLSADFPRTTTNFPTALSANLDLADVFVAKLNSNNTNLDYSITFGGAGKDEGRDLAVDSSGRVHVIGTTESTDFPTNEIFGYLNDTLTGGSDAFLAEINSAGDAFNYSGYLGGPALDYGYAVALDGGGNSYSIGEFNKDPFILKILADTTLAIIPVGTNVSVSWPGYAAEYVLQSSTNLLATNAWQTVAVPSVFTNNQHVVTLPATNAADFFRLTK